ncbi:MAG TPA: DMT family transporter [Burkholderiales bacterium]
MHASVVLAALSACLFGAGVVVARFGLRYVNGQVGASISIPFSCLMFWVAAPFLLDTSGASARAAGLFLVVGLFFPTATTLFLFESIRRMGPTVAGSLSSTAAVFAIFTAILFLGEEPNWRIALGTAAILAGVVAFSGGARAGHAQVPRRWANWELAFPLGSAAVRGLAQTLTKFGIAWWHNPYAASLIGYTISAIVVLIATRGAVRRAGRFDRRAYPWFMGVGACNGLGLFLMYTALGSGQVGVVSPIVTTSPLFTLLLSWLFIRDERISARTAVGVGLTLLGILVIIRH